jgi:ketosteroid isomerase-like protein
MTKSHLTGAAMVALLVASVGACSKPRATTSATDTVKIAAAIKADAAQSEADFNAHNAAKLSSHDAPDVVGMYHGAPNVVGAVAALDRNQKSLAAGPSQHVTLANGSVDVAGSGEMAIYRSTYVFTVVDPKTEKTVTESGNYLAGYKLQPDRSWKITWSVISDSAPPLGTN